MEVFVSMDGKQLGPFSLENLHEMKRLGNFGAETLVWAEGQTDWLPINEFLALHPTRSTPQAAKAGHGKKRRPSRLRGLAGAFVAGIVGGALVAGLAALTGALFTFLWWGIGWASGAVGRSWAGKSDQAIGLFAFLATVLGIFISGAGLEVHSKGVVLFGGVGVLISLPGSLWLAFKTGRTPA
jgi:hypothetical protein